MKEAILYQIQDNQKVNCNICFQRCTIAEGKRGICGVRENHQGKLYALNYGQTVAAHIDPIEKKPLYHFLPGTKIYSLAAVGCNFRCAWCQNWQIAQSPKSHKKIEGTMMTPEEHVRMALAYDCPSIAYTYSEPTIFVEYALETMKLAKAKGLKNVWVTNGFMSKETLDEIIPCLDAANVDFKGPDDTVYEEYCGGQTEPVMENLKRLYEAGVHLEITTLVVPGVNDQEVQLEKIAQFISTELGQEVPWHVSRFFPVWKMTKTPVTPVETLKMAERIGNQAGLRYIHVGNI
ncbi:AmmeMemoRadiSam system radical SAM enzyme [Heliophilum fasciatum]|uniref:Pyruvate formate lyase activating enzyme n=1 Tax=Heliophilum fasciatum TaxID=35700 RepID=A0A4R2R6P8_9FIRM|nr:AmmeMemoRadiSam system radical SAM enzyme [Heliophilum fasciatum]MCW2279495.1 pyruvate formate lyase activating enzyme [Heliophilum fasciatum]TCP58732.1 pyruvate formate lyase activating enzyme [Heliophilum fasciatum]